MAMTRSLRSLGYELKEGKLSIVAEEAERVRMIFSRYLALGSVNRLVLELRERNVRTKIRKLSNGSTRGGVPFQRPGDSKDALEKPAVSGHFPRVSTCRQKT